MGMEVYQGAVAGEIVISGIDTKKRIGNGGMGHINAINNFLKEGGGAVVRLDVVNGEDLDGGRKVKCTAYLTKGVNRSHDKQSETNQRSDHGKNNRKPIKERS